MLKEIRERFRTEDADPTDEEMDYVFNLIDRMAECISDLMEYSGIIEERCDSVATDKALAILEEVNP